MGGRLGGEGTLQVGRKGFTDEASLQMGGGLGGEPTLHMGGKVS